MAKTRFEDGDLWVDIDLDLCTGAGECVDVCPEDVYEIVDGKVTASNIGDCSECLSFFHLVQMFFNSFFFVMKCQIDFFSSTTGV